MRPAPHATAKQGPGRPTPRPTGQTKTLFHRAHAWFRTVALVNAPQTATPITFKVQKCAQFARAPDIPHTGTSQGEDNTNQNDVTHQQNSQTRSVPNVHTNKHARHA
eukprot:5157980-Lingulodinium_polyedra.AAC.1